MAVGEVYDATRHVIHTRGDGLLATTTADQVRAIAQQAAAEDRVVIHFHGGLVSSDHGFDTARRLTAQYERAGAYPVFFVWSSGLVDVVTGNLREILTEDLCKRLLRWLLRFVVGKLDQTAAQRAARQLTLPYEMEVNAQLKARDEGGEPYDGRRPADELAPVDDDERGQLEVAVAADDDLAAQLESVLAGLHPERVVTGARGVAVERRTSEQTWMSPDVLAAIDPGPAAGERGILSTALLARKLAAVFAKVVERFRDGTDHGVYPTAVEELLREFYLANAGAAVWAAMKKDTLDTFAAGDAPHAGALFLAELGRALAASGNRPQVTLVGHSTGAVFIDNALDALARAQSAGAMPADVAVRNVVLLAPAATFGHLAQGLLKHADRVGRVRVFTMADDAERADHLVKAVYPRSLLYLVAGLLERDASGRSSYVPVAGMQRYYNERYDALDGVAAVRAFATGDRLVLSPTADGAAAGLRAAALSHGAFDEDPDVLASIRAIVAGSNE
ncbi:MAG TPA: hypothetical protein VEK80_10900 [Kribbellaceae bacterium]|nr:hypothetical protein [Kribbellaceae bacterium]